MVANTWLIPTATRMAFGVKPIDIFSTLYLLNQMRTRSSKTVYCLVLRKREQAEREQQASFVLTEARCENPASPYTDYNMDGEGDGNR